MVPGLCSILDQDIKGNGANVGLERRVIDPTTVMAKDLHTWNLRPRRIDPLASSLSCSC